METERSGACPDGESYDKVVRGGKRSRRRRAKSGRKCSAEIHRAAIRDPW